MKAQEAASKPKVVFLDRATISETVRLRPFSFAHEYVAYQATSAEQVVERIAQAQVVIVNKVKLPASVLAQAHRLQLIAVAATGTDNIDLQACRDLGIEVLNVRDYAVTTVPEHTLALMLALRRNVLAYRDSVVRGRWQESGQFCYFDYPIRDLAGSTLGVIGSGALGSAVAALGRALGMTVLFAGRKGQAATPPRTPFAEVLARSDVLTLHLPLTPETRHLIGEAEFAMMARRPLLINTARGGLVDERALGMAIRGGQIAGAAFDVADGEPPGRDHPLMGLLDLPNFILTPHVAWASQEAMQALADQLVDNVEGFWRQRA